METGSLEENRKGTWEEEKREKKEDRRVVRRTRKIKK